MQQYADYIIPLLDMREMDPEDFATRN
jgi:hypothetical protein